jgi:hypothetical protein
MEKPRYESYMKVEDVLRWLNKVNNPLTTQYKLVSDGKESDCNFFKCADLVEIIGERTFRVMECDVTQHLVKVTNVEDNKVTTEQF